MPNMEKGGDVAMVHPKLVAAMKREGWKPVQADAANPEEAAKNPKKEEK